MTATVIDLRTRRALPAVTETVTKWWRCPTWCPGDCAGGETLTWPDGGGVTTDRIHTLVLATVGDLVIEQVRWDAPDETPETRIVARVGEVATQLDDVQRQQLAAALTGRVA